MRTIPVIICIDVEPDKREIDVAVREDWGGFADTLTFWDAFRPQLAAATAGSANLSWFFRMDPQIEHAYGHASWVTQRYGSAVERIERAGDELGLHTHAWRWNRTLGKWVTDHGNQGWIEQCLGTSFAAYRTAFGRPCRSFRFGDRWMNNATMGVLESLGVRFDLTLEPGMRARAGLVPSELSTGSLPDCRRVPRRPYRASRRDFRTPGHGSGRAVWTIPLSTEIGVGRFDGIKQAARAFGIDLYKPRQFNLALDPLQFRTMTHRLLDLRKASYLAPVMRTDALTSPASHANVERNMRFLMSCTRTRRLTFVTPADAMALLA